MDFDPDPLSPPSGVRPESPMAALGLHIGGAWPYAPPSPLAAGPSASPLVLPSLQGVNAASGKANSGSAPMSAAMSVGDDDGDGDGDGDGDDSGWVKPPAAKARKTTPSSSKEDARKRHRMLERERRERINQAVSDIRQAVHAEDQDRAAVLHTAAQQLRQQEKLRLELRDTAQQNLQLRREVEQLRLQFSAMSEEKERADSAASAAKLDSFFSHDVVGGGGGGGGSGDPDGDAAMHSDSNASTPSAGPGSGSAASPVPTTANVAVTAERASLVDYEKLFKDNGMPMCIASLGMQVLDMNERFAKLIGAKVGMTGITCTQLSPVRDFHKLFALMQRLMSGQDEMGQMVKHLMTLKGEEITVIATFMLIRDEQREPKYVMVTVMPMPQGLSPEDVSKEVSAHVLTPTGVDPPDLRTPPPQEQPKQN